MSFQDESQNREPVYNNADSFGMAFDEAWKSLKVSNIDQNIDQKEKLKIVLEAIKDHPYQKDQPSKAKQVANFRIRLLKLS